MNISFLQARTQRGGTLVGFVVGLLVGLGLALSVAVYVTRVPVPFVDRGVTRKPADDAAEAERNKGWNPNAGLVNKAPPLPTPAETPPPVAGDTAPKESPAAEPDKAPAAKAADAAKPDTDPLGDLMKAKAGAPAEPAAAQGADPFTYFVQAGAFKSPEEAQAQKARLAMLGMDATITEREQSGRTVFRVRMGPFGQKSMAEATREQLEVNGVEAALVRVQR
ncbi:SPOR domain-containing protein [Hydrogenophaga luteola]|uniref:SPOR domain-containing protein n=1 Tax=Hydrogenophaga luteola TaxID=1591122 RepID=A0ABV7W294_9BURK